MAESSTSFDDIYQNLYLKIILLYKFFKHDDKISKRNLSRWGLVSETI
jgi:hypothetical protein